MSETNQEELSVEDILSSIKDILVDEAPMVLQNLLSSLGMRGGVRAITLTEK